MAKIKMETKVLVAADTLWQTIGQFNGLGLWHPAVAKSATEGEGKAVNTIQGVYQAGFDNLRKMFGG